MPIQNPKELFVMLLSDLRQNEERTTTILQALSELAKDPDIKEPLESRIFLKTQTLASIDHCFELTGANRVQRVDRFHEVYLEGFRRELAEIQSPVARHLYILAKVKYLTHMQIGEYIALIAMADITRHYGIGMLLEACLAEKLTLVERMRRLLTRSIELQIGKQLAA